MHSVSDWFMRRNRFYLSDVIHIWNIIHIFSYSGMFSMVIWFTWVFLLTAFHRAHYGSAGFLYSRKVTAFSAVNLYQHQYVTCSIAESEKKYFLIFLSLEVIYSQTKIPENNNQLSNFWRPLPELYRYACNLISYSETLIEWPCAGQWSVVKKNS